MTHRDLHTAARSVVAAYESGGVEAVESWLRREFGVAVLTGTVAYTTALARLDGTLADLTDRVNGLVPDLSGTDVAD